jgi:oxygen-independent coproporphyrinogen-3 oxidase
MKGLYIHIPFCVRKCSYCDFYSLPNRQPAIADYLQAVLQEAQSNICHSDVTQYQKNLVLPPTTPDKQEKLLYRETGESRVRGDSNPSFQTLYIGGGTPSLLGPQNLQTLITGLSGIFSSPNPSVGASLELARPNRQNNNNISPLAPGGEVPRMSRERELERGGSSELQRTYEGVPFSHCERSAAIRHRSSVLNPVFNGTNVSGKGGNSWAESTLEVNPESATPEFLQTAKTLGFNRLSFGVQSLSDAELHSVGRIHTAAQAVAAIKLAQKTGFQNISADLIIGLPGQTWHSLHNSLEALTALGLPHLSVYCLSLENGTPLALNPPPNLPSDDTQAELYEKTRTFLINAGFVHYEISNYARPGFACLHNLNYWRGGEYLGIGPAAASHLDGKRFKNKNDLDAYLQNPAGQIEYVEELALKEKAAEEAMLRLRLLEEGLNTDELTAKFGPTNTSNIIARLDQMAQEELLLKTGSTYRLSPAHILTSNPIFSRIISNDPNE